MNCERIHLMIEETISGRASQQEQQDLAAHIKGCPDCLAEYENAVITHRTITSVADVAPPSGISSAVMQSIKSQKVAAPAEANVIPFRIPSMRLIGGMVAIAAAVAALFLIPSWMAPNGSTTPTGTIAATPTPEPAPVQAPESIEFQCRASAVKGEVLVMSGGAWKSLSEGEGLAIGSSVRTGAGASFTMVYPDSTSIGVKPESELTVRLEAIMLKHGATWLRVTKRGSKFEVHTPNAIAGVMGTRFGVCARPDGGSCISLFEGKVWVGAGKVAGESVRRLILEPGQKVSVAENGLVSPVFKTGQGEEDAWSNPSAVLADSMIHPYSSMLSTDAAVPSADSATETATTDSESASPQVETGPAAVDSGADTHYDTMSGLDNDAENE